MKPKIKGKSLNFPSLRNVFTDFFEGDRFFDKDWWPANRWFEGSMLSAVPATNIKETDKNFMLEVAVPGMDKKDFHVSVDNGIINIWAEREETKEEKEENYTRKEYNFNSFRRSFILPENVKKDGVKASYENGVLTIVMSKKKVEEAKTTKEITVA